MSDALDAEFDTVAAWTADAALALGPEYFLPAACRGSGPPAAMSWLLEQFGGAGDLLDCGAGVGGPAEFAHRAGFDPVLLEYEGGACRAARRLFDLPTVHASATDLPFPDRSFAQAWSLGVLCTVPDHLRMLTELRRVLTGAGRVGLLVYAATEDVGADAPDGNDFPADAELLALFDRAGLAVTATADLADFGDPHAEWTERAGAVEAEVERRHGDEDVWQAAEEQTGRFGRLLADGRVVGRLLVATPR